jgi:hypothetical protein
LPANRVQNAVGTSGFFSLRIPQFESHQPCQVRLRSELPAPTFARPTPAEILAGAVYSQRRSSNANSLRSAVSAKSPKVMAPIQMDFVPDGLRSSSLITPATQSSLPE